MNALFNAIVDLLRFVCRHTGLTYAEINILLYCGLVPATWALLLWRRRRNLWWVPAIHLFAIVGYLRARPWLSGFSDRFYDVNISALQYLANVSGFGYVGISILAGVVFPAGLYAALWSVPRRWLPALYVALIVGNLAYYTWVWTGIN